MKRGYTLVEILMGVFIMSIGLVSILGAFPIGMRIVHKIKRTTMLCNFANLKMAEFQAYANPRDTLCHGEQAGGPVNPHVMLPADTFTKTPGIQGDRTNGEDYGILGGPNGAPTLKNFAIWGAGKHLHWKVTDFEYFVRSVPGTYDLVRSEYDYGYITNSDARMGITQNQRRFEEAYGFTRKYIVEVWEGGERTKTDPDFDGLNDVLEVYYAFSTAIWNAHIFHSTEWSPVMRSNAYGSATCAGGHDYFWTWNNTLEEWGYNAGRTQNVLNSDNDAVLGPPGSASGSNYPWC
ncbi:prepilin-type N-terminal cleavage/methylation domain-containing protein [Planctomycetota bacterium]